MGKLALNNALSNLGAEVKPLPDYSSQVRHDIEYQRIQQLPNGLYVPKSSYLYQHSNLASELYFDDRPGLAIGRQESRHGVMFGKLGSLAVENFVEIVAVKPSDKPEQILGELAILQYLQDKTSFPTFRPVAYLSNEQESYLFTEFNPDIHVLGMFDWRHASELQKKAIIKEVSNGLGRLHANFLYHGDALVRNLALNSRNKFFIVDPELMVSGKDIANIIYQSGLKSHQKELLIGQLSRPMSADITSFYNSLLARAYKQSQIKTSQQILEFLTTNILQSYKEGLASGSDIKNNSLVNELYEIIEKSFRQRAEQEIL